MRLFLTIFSTLVFIGCMEKSKQTNESDVVFEKFQLMLKDQGIEIDSVDESGLVHLSSYGINYQVSLDNARKDYESSGHFGILENIVESFKKTVPKNLTFEETQPYIYPHLIPSDLEIKDVSYDSITDQAHLVYVVYKDGNQSFIMSHDIEDWEKSIDEIRNTAFNNLNVIVDTIKIDTIEIEGKPLGFFETEFSMKSTCLLSAELKKRVEKKFGWPVCAVFPVKDFCYIFRENYLEFFSGRLGGTVIKEYTNSPHPISTELVRITNNGFEVIGEYPRE